jgi:hypothetical protein
MKTISSALAQHLASEVTTLASCCKVTRRDGVALGFTDHVRALEVDGVTYRAASGYTRTAIRSTADLAVDNLDVESVFSDDGITEDDLRAGQYDFAEVRMFLVNHENLGQGILKLRRGWLGEVTIRDGMYAPSCAADLGDARCAVNLAALEKSGTVDTVIDGTTFETTLVQGTGWYDGSETLVDRRRQRRADRRGAQLGCGDWHPYTVPPDAVLDADKRRLHDPPRLLQDVRDLRGQVRQRDQLPRLPARPGNNQVLR